nr:MAG TPA: hypothetical protein [Caudoviricetes sp.]
MFLTSMLITYNRLFISEHCVCIGCLYNCLTDFLVSLFLYTLYHLENKIGV